MSDRIVVACAADENYALPLTVMLKSVEINSSPESNITIYIFDGGLTLDSRLRVIASLNPLRMRIRWRRVPKAMVAGYPISGHINATTYSRLLIPDLLPAHVRKVVYLDADVVVLRDLGDLWNQSFEGRPLLAVQDGTATLSSPNGVRRYRELGWPGEAKYLNAGVLVMNLDMWRRNGVHRKVFDYLSRYAESVILHDQDGINATLATQWGELDQRWNYLVSVCAPYHGTTEEGNAILSRIRAEAAIVHYVGAIKPWYAGVNHPAKVLFFEYLRHTAWRKWTPAESFHRVLPARYEIGRFLQRMPVIGTVANWLRQKVKSRPNRL